MENFTSKKQGGATMWIAHCHQCGHFFEDIGDREQVELDRLRAGWGYDMGNLYCPRCLNMIEGAKYGST